MKLPSIHESASASSDRAQQRFLWLVRLEYGSLIATSLLYLIPTHSYLNIALMMLVLIALGSFGYRAWKKPDEDWYQFRALAESVKTMAWRYSVRAAPFQSDDNVAQAEFRNKLKQLLKANATLGPRFEHVSADTDQITEDMAGIRNSELSKRKINYKSNRIQDQRTWYARKARINKESGRNWSVALVIFYLMVFLVLALKIAHPNSNMLSPEPFLVAASSIIGWMQVKKFNDLAAAYLLTAHEIGIAATELDEIDTDAAWSKFVNSCERVFSREHTQWVARRLE